MNEGYTSAFNDLVELEKRNGGTIPDVPIEDVPLIRDHMDDDPEWPRPATTAGVAESAAERVPLEPYRDNDGATLRVSITYGTVGGLELNTYGPITITTTTYFFAKMTCTGGGSPSTLVLHTQGTSSVSDSDTVSYLQIGRAVVAGGEITAVERNLAGSKSYERCGYVGNYTHYFDPI